MATAEGAMENPSPGTDTWFIEAFNRLARGKPASVEAFFDQVGGETIIDGTQTTCRVNWLASDGNGRPRLQDLTQYLADSVLGYCITRSRIAEALKEYDNNGSTVELSRLMREGRSYFSKADKSGEAGELLLFFLMESGLGIPQILCKMPLKTNTNMPIHGVDGVHARALPNGNLAVYWGESKMYKDFNSAVTSCMESIAPYLKDEGGGPLRQDLILVRDNLNVEQLDLSITLAEFFTSDSPQRKKLEMRGACLIGFEENNFTTPFESDKRSVLKEVTDLITDWHSQIGRKVNAKGIESIVIEFFCLPIPSMENFRKHMQEALGIKVNN